MADVTDAAGFTGGGLLTVADGTPFWPPTAALYILDPTVERAPGSLTITLTDGDPDSPMDFSVDGVLVATVQTDEEGSIGPTTIPVPSDVLAGEHTLSVSGAGTDSETFTVLLDPLPEEPADEPDADPVPVGTKWVFQDLRTGGLGSWEMPINPGSMTAPHVQRPLTAMHTTAPRTGMFHIFEGGPTPVEWSFSGYLPTQEMHDKLVAYGNLNRRIYIIDHRDRAWLVTITFVDIHPRLRHNFDGTVTDWGHDYTVHALVLNQKPVIR